MRKDRKSCRAIPFPKSSHRTRCAATAISWGLQLFKDHRVSLAGHNEDPLDYRRKDASDFWISWVCRRCVSQPSLGLVVSVAMGAEPQEVESDGTESNKEE